MFKTLFSFPMIKDIHFNKILNLEVTVVRKMQWRSSLIHIIIYIYNPSTHSPIHWQLAMKHFKHSLKIYNMYLINVKLIGTQAKIPWESYHFHLNWFFQNENRWHLNRINYQKKNNNILLRFSLVQYKKRPKAIFTVINNMSLSYQHYTASTT